MGLVGLTPSHSEWLDRPAMRKYFRDTDRYCNRNDPSLHHTCASNLSSLNGLSKGCRVVRRQNKSLIGCKLQQDIRLTWQYDRHAGSVP